MSTISLILAVLAVWVMILGLFTMLQASIHLVSPQVVTSSVRVPLYTRVMPLLSLPLALAAVVLR